MRVYLVVIDDTPESGIALRFAARRAVKTGGGVEILALIPPQEFIAFGGVQATIEEEARLHAQGLVARRGGHVARGIGSAPDDHRARRRRPGDHPRDHRRQSGYRGAGAGRGRERVARAAGGAFRERSGRIVRCR